MNFLTDGKTQVILRAHRYEAKERRLDKQSFFDVSMSRKRRK